MQRHPRLRPRALVRGCVLHRALPDQRRHRVRRRLGQPVRTPQHHRIHQRLHRRRLGLHLVVAVHRCACGRAAIEGELERALDGHHLLRAVLALHRRQAVRHRRHVRVQIPPLVRVLHHRPAQLGLVADVHAAGHHEQRQLHVRVAAHTAHTRGIWPQQRRRGVRHARVAETIRPGQRGQRGRRRRWEGACIIASVAHDVAHCAAHCVIRSAPTLLLACLRITLAHLRLAAGRLLLAPEALEVELVQVQLRAVEVARLLLHALHVRARRALDERQECLEHVAGAARVQDAHLEALVQVGVSQQRHHQPHERTVLRGNALHDRRVVVQVRVHDCRVHVRWEALVHQRVAT
mmetsp:Transcript_19912/g.63299  ORF Transcript_19912/g.63299 Transcript_19912/m.63299 type:complete len:349 (+) Transcript_19912:434-1480(+)